MKRAARDHVALHRIRESEWGLWLVNTVVLGLICGACAFTVADWAADQRLGVFNVVSMP